MLEVHVSSNRQMTSNYASVSTQMKGFKESKAQSPFSVPTWQQIKGITMPTVTPKHEKVLCSNFKQKISWWNQQQISLPLSPAASWDNGVCQTLRHLILSHNTAKRKPISLLCCLPHGCVAVARLLLERVTWGWAWGLLRLNLLEHVILTSEMCTSTFQLQMLNDTLNQNFKTWRRWFSRPDLQLLKPWGYKVSFTMMRCKAFGFSCTYKQKYFKTKRNSLKPNASSFPKLWLPMRIIFLGFF